MIEKKNDRKLEKEIIKIFIYYQDYRFDSSCSFIVLRLLHKSMLIDTT